MTALLAVGLIWLAGCGSDVPAGPTLEPVSGTVYLNEEPLPNALVTFMPTGETPGVGGQTRTDAQGKFSVNYGRGGAGLPPGDYRVAVSLRLLPDGSPEKADVDPIESQAQETLPPKYSNIEQSELRVKVEKGKPVELKLTN